MERQQLNDQMYLELICNMLREVEQQELPQIEKAAETAYQSIRGGGLLHVFSTGHSHMIVEELFYRAGGLIPVNPILDNSLMLHESAVGSTINERTPGKAAEVLGKAGLQPGDTIIISSNSGVNIVPVEAALYAREHGVKVVVITSLGASAQLSSRHPGGQKLCELGDIVIDNHAPFGDGMLHLPENGQPTGGASTFSSLFIGQRIVLKIENLYIADGLVPPIYMSANTPGGDAFNEIAMAPYIGRIKALC